MSAMLRVTLPALDFRFEKLRQSPHSLLRILLKRLACFKKLVVPLPIIVRKHQKKLVQIFGKSRQGRSAALIGANGAEHEAKLSQVAGAFVAVGHRPEVPASYLNERFFEALRLVRGRHGVDDVVDVAVEEAGEVVRVKLTRWSVTRSWGKL